MRSGAPENLAILAGLFAGVAFGVFWIPLRAIETTGLPALWAICLITLVPALWCVPFAWRYRAQFRRGGRGLLGGALIGLAYALYSASFFFTEVIRAVLLFYLLPIWGFALGRLLLGEVITLHRWLAMGCGFFGMLVIFSAGGGMPLPRNEGDWFALGSGMAWAVGSMLVLLDRPERPVFHMTLFFGVAAIMCTGVVVAATVLGQVALPSFAAFGAVLVWLAPLSLFFLLPVGFATVFAPARLNPGVVGLLFMIEVAVASVTAAIWAGEPISAREWLGLALVMGAGLIEPLVVLRKARVAAP
ncbi:MAG: DMT family transporter [Pseudomonadota bacterium]